MYYLPPIIALLAALVAINKHTWNKDAIGLKTITTAGWVVVLIAFTGCIVSEIVIYKTRQAAEKYSTELRQALIKLDTDFTHQSNKKILDHLIIELPYALFNKDGRVVVSLGKGGASLELSTRSGSMCNLTHSIKQNNIKIYVGLCTPGDLLIPHDVIIDQKRSLINPYKLRLEIKISDPFPIIPDNYGFEIAHPRIELTEISQYKNLISSQTIYGCPNRLILNHAKHERYGLCVYGIERDVNRLREVKVLSLIYKKDI